MKTKTRSEARSLSKHYLTENFGKGLTDTSHIEYRKLRNKNISQFISK